MWGCPNKTSCAKKAKSVIESNGSWCTQSWSCDEKWWRSLCAEQSPLHHCHHTFCNCFFATIFCCVFQDSFISACYVGFKTAAAVASLLPVYIVYKQNWIVCVMWCMSALMLLRGIYRYMCIYVHNACMWVNMNICRYMWVRLKSGGR